MNNETVAAFIEANFIPVAGAVEHLQKDRWGTNASPAAQWFDPIAKRIQKEKASKFQDEFHTLQGMYVIGADGTPYEYKIGMPYRSDEFVATLRSALSAYGSRPQKTASTVPVPASDASLPLPGRDYSTVRVVSRILPLPQNATLSERSPGFDTMWILPEEVKAIADSATTLDTAVPMPPSLVARMVRFHLLNHSGNIMRPFDEGDVQCADFKVALKASGPDVRTYKFNGLYKSHSPSSADGGEGSVEGSLSGEFQASAKENKIVRWLAYGEAECAGRNDSLVKGLRYPVVFGMKEANDQLSRSIAPIWASIPLIAPVYKQPRISSKSGGP